MSCDTNDKSIELPSSISFSTPSVSLVEADDLLDESSCEVSGQEETSAYAEGTKECTSGDSCLSTSDSQSAVNLPMGNPVPRLSITLPSSHVVEISQNFYWPLYTKPIDWMYQEHVSETCNQTELQARLRRTAEELQSMSFFQSVVMKEEEASADPEERNVSAIDIVMQQLSEEKEDWFNDLSGGQVSTEIIVK